jgi:hypothetical protein
VLVYMMALVVQKASVDRPADDVRVVELVWSRAWRGGAPARFAV